MAPTHRLLSTATLVSGLLGLAACGSSNSAAQPQIPLTAFNTSISLLDQHYTALRFDNGAQFVPGGVKGLIVVRQNAATYLAFERNCPYQPNDACSRVGIDPSRLFLRDSCCTSQFSLQGQVQGGPSRYPLRQYTTSLSGTILTITN